MSRIRIVGGKITEIVGGDYNFYSKGNITTTAGGTITETAKEGIKYGEPESIEIKDAFMPIVTLIESKNYQYIFEDIEGKVYELDFKLDRDKRNQGAKKLRFISDEPLIPLTFKVTKGNKASEDDSGEIKAKIFFVNGDTEEQTFDTSYGKTFDLYVDPKKIAHIKFYANDDDWIFKGGVSNVFCGALNYDCQKPLVKQAVKSINYLTKEEKAKFIAAVLVETGNGKKELWDIAYIYLNLVNNYGFEEGMKKSSAYENSWVYDCHLRHLIVYHYKVKVYKDFSDWDKIVGPKNYKHPIKIKVEDFKEMPTVIEFIKFCEENIFIKSPMSLYKDWEGQGNFEDMNIRMHKDEREKWAKASQYFHLQNQCKVKEKLVVELFIKPSDIFQKPTKMKENGDATTYLFDEKKINEYFKKHPEKLPDYTDGDILYSATGKKINETSPKNTIPPVYGFRTTINKND